MCETRLLFLHAPRLNVQQGSAHKVEAVVVVLKADYVDMTSLDTRAIYYVGSKYHCNYTRV